MKTILVTGGAGFIGSNLCERLLKDGHHVLCLDNLYTGSIQNIKHLFNHPKFKFMNHDIITPLYMPFKIDQIYNLACPASPPKYNKTLFTLYESIFKEY